MTETKETQKVKKEVQLPTPKALATMEEYFEDRAKHFRPSDLDYTRSWANKQLLKLEADGFPVISSVLNFEPSFAQFIVKEVIHNQEFDWASKKYTLFGRADRVYPTVEPTGAPLPGEMHQNVICLKIGMASNFGKQANLGQQAIEPTSRTAVATAAAFNAAKRRYNWDGNPMVLGYIHKQGTQFNLIRTIALLTRYGCDVATTMEENKWLYEL